MLPKLCHLDNDLVIIIMYTVLVYINNINIYAVVCSTHDSHTLPGGIFFLTVSQCGPGL